VLGGGGAGDHDPFVVGEVLPAHEDQPAPGAKAAGDVGERGRRVGEEHHTETAQGDIARAGREAVHLGVAVLKTDIGQSLLLGAAGRLAQHRRGQVHPQGLSFDCDPPSRSGRGPGAATDVDDPVGASDGGRGQQVVGERRQHALVALLVDQPMHGLVAVPVAGLLLVRHRPGLHGPQSTPSSTLEVKMSDRLLTIGELARRAGVATSALRYYEEFGLLPTAARISGQRRYPESAVGLVGIILLLRDVGFSLAEQKALMASRAVALDDWQRLARHKLAELDDQIAKAQTAREAIDHALRCPHEDILECPNFASVIAARLTGQPLHEAHPH